MVGRPRGRARVSDEETQVIPAPDGLWFCVGETSTRDFFYLSLADVEARAQPIP